MLARVLELAGGKPFDELLEEFVFAPAGAVHSVSPVPHRLIPGRARSYVGGFGQLEATSLQDLTFLIGAVLGSGLFIAFGRPPAEKLIAYVQERMRGN